MPIDLGAMLSTGIMGTAYNKLKAYLGLNGGRTRMYDLGQQLAEPELQVLERFGCDVLPLFAGPPKRWKEWKLPDGSPCEVPEGFNPERLPDGSQVLRDSAGNITSRMPAGGYYFDGVSHSLAHISSVAELDNVEFFTPLSEAVIDDLHQRAEQLHQTTDYAIMLNGVGGIYEWAQGLRGWGQFIMDLAGDPDFAGALLHKLVDASIARARQILPAVEGYVQVLQLGDDMGMQDGPQLSPELYRRVVKPRHRRLYEFVKEHTSAYLFLHTCGSVYEFIPDFIEMGIDILNPVQVAARDMDSARLKREFGKDIVFWGGGCDTQHVLPFGTPQEVDAEVKGRIADLAPGGGFVFCQVHNIQANTPPENIVAMYEAAARYGRY